MQITILLLAGFLLIRRSAVLAAIGRRLYLSGKERAAFRFHKAAERVGTMPEGAAVYYGYILLREGMIEDSRKILAYQSLYAKKPAVRVQAKASYAILLNKEGRTEEAVEILEEIYDKNGASTVNYGSLGHMYLTLDSPKAMAFCKEAYEYNNEDNIICSNYAAALIKSGDKEYAEQVLKEAIDRTPAFPEIYLDYARLLKERGDYEGASEHLKQALACKRTFLTSVTSAEIEAELADINM